MSVDKLYKIFYNTTMLKKLYHKFWAKDSERTKANYSRVELKNVKSYKNFVYGFDGKNNLLDVHIPDNSDNEKLPTVFIVHGGGYVSGCKDDTDCYAKLIAEKGFCVVNVEYTKCDGKEHKYFSDIITEFYDMFDYVKNNLMLKKYIDFDNVFLAGDSAGAHIVSMIANIQTNPLIKSEFTDKIGPKIKGLILVSPLFGPYKFKGFKPLKNNFEDIVYGKNLKDTSNRYHAFDYLSDDFPSTLMFSAKNDFVVSMHKKEFIKKAQKLNIPLIHCTVKKGYKLSHDFLVKHTKHYPECINIIKDFVNDRVNNKTLKGQNLLEIEEQLIKNNEDELVK